MILTKFIISDCLRHGEAVRKGFRNYVVKSRILAIPDQFQDLSPKNKYFMSSFLQRLMTKSLFNLSCLKKNTDTNIVVFFYSIHL